MRGIKLPLHDFTLKMQGGLMREGGRIAGHYGICHVINHMDWISITHSPPLHAQPLLPEHVGRKEPGIHCLHMHIITLC